MEEEEEEEESRNFYKMLLKWQVYVLCLYFVNQKILFLLQKLLKQFSIFNDCLYHYNYKQSSTMVKKGKPKSHKEQQGAKPKTRIMKPRPKTIGEFHTAFKKQPNQIKNKIKRVEVNYKRTVIKNQIKMKERKERQKLPSEMRQKPITIEDKQQGGEEFVEDYDEAMFDEFNKILEHDGPVKILITTQLKPPVKIYNFLREIMMVFHNIAFYPRRQMKLEDVYKYAKSLNYTHVMVLRYSNGWELLIRHLEGMLAVFKITSVEFQKQIKHHAVATEHVPELILNNFDSKVGVRMGRLFASLFPQQPQFRGRRVVTFHNQRDFIFFRHHRYIFTEGYEGVNMQEIGPRFTLRVKKVYAGDEERLKGLEFEAKANMYVERKAAYL